MIPGVIVIDDSVDDRYVARRAIGRAKLAERVVELDDGDELIPLMDDHVRARAECGTPPPPLLVLLDINMPRMNGFELLKEIEERVAKRKILLSCFVVMMFTSSNNEKDREESLRYSFVRDYLVKPIDAEGLRSAVEKHYGEI